LNTFSCVMKLQKDTACAPDLPRAEVEHVILAETLAEPTLDMNAVG
jgi:hypothetical protein